MPTISDRAGWLAGLILLALSGAIAAESAPRAVSLAPSLTELAFAAGAGDRLVGAVEWSDYPPEAAELPLIGDAFRFDLERIVALSPDLALAWQGGTPVRAAARIESVGIRVVWVATSTLEEIATALEQVGAELGRAESGRKAAGGFRQRLKALKTEYRTEQRPIPVFYQVASRPLYTLGGRHVINEVMAICGMENLFAGLDTEAAVVDFEAVLAAGPQMILAGDEPGNSDPLKRWRESGLVDDGVALHRVEATLLVRPTPRLADGIEALCSLREGG